MKKQRKQLDTLYYLLKTEMIEAREVLQERISRDNWNDVYIGIQKLTVEVKSYFDALDIIENFQYDLEKGFRESYLKVCLKDHLFQASDIENEKVRKKLIEGFLDISQDL